jgi:hypothetical protein
MGLGGFSRKPLKKSRLMQPRKSRRLKVVEVSRDGDAVNEVGPFVAGIRDPDLESTCDRANFAQEESVNFLLSATPSGTQKDLGSPNRGKRVKMGDLRKQKRIWDFMECTEPDKADADVFYQVVEKIYVYFNRQKKIPVILAAIHECAGNVGNAIQVLAEKGKGRLEKQSNRFSYLTVAGDAGDCDRYFRT